MPLLIFQVRFVRKLPSAVLFSSEMFITFVSVLNKKKQTLIKYGTMLGSLNEI